TSDEFGELLSNGSLTGVAHQQSVFADEVFGVISGGTHSSLTVGQFRCGSLQHGREDSRLNVLGQQCIQDIFWRWFVVVEWVQFRLVGDFFFHYFQWEKTNDRWVLFDHALEL